ncbi:MAG TPA: DNA gyrase subunit B, partial [Bryobacteraceae bacterium]|nr:DNA gyrase subunit B [Bryobacteraceae bacterium]
KDDREFTAEVLRRAIESIAVDVESVDGPLRVEKGELRAFLMKLDDLQSVFRQAERRLRDGRVVELLLNPQYSVDTKADFADKTNLEPLYEALKLLNLPAELRFDEQHSVWQVTYRDAIQAERTVGVELAAQAEYKRLRMLAREVAKYNHPPFTAIKEGMKETLTHWRDLLAYVKSEGMRDASVQRYKGLGEMNAEQLWDTTMNPEKRTLLQVRLEDMVECEEIFSTLMGENVESRRRFIEDNALDVRNLDV